MHATESPLCRRSVGNHDACHHEKNDTQHIDKHILIVNQEAEIPLVDFIVYRGDLLVAAVLNDTLEHPAPVAVRGHLQHIAPERIDDKLDLTVMKLSYPVRRVRVPACYLSLVFFRT